MRSKEVFVVEDQEIKKYNMTVEKEQKGCPVEIQNHYLENQYVEENHQ